MELYSVQKNSSNEESFMNSVKSNIDSDYICITKNEIKCYLKNIKNDDRNIITLSIKQRKYLNLTINEAINVSIVDVSNSSYIKKSECFVNLLNKNKVTIDGEDFCNHIKNTLKNIPINNSLEYLTKYNDIGFVLTFLNIPNNDFIFMDDDIEINLICNPSEKNLIIEKSHSIFRNEFSINKMNIGGLSKELELIFRRGFSTRVLSNKTCQELDIKHIKGIMLHGAPGCGKTLIARELGKIVGCDEPTIICGPELISSYQGKSEENVRNLFNNAYNNPKKLFVIILDEADAILKKRQGHFGSSTENNITNQFLTMIDGPKSLNNIILICMTNRLDLIDEAIIRPGRIELIIEIGLPTYQGRIDIFNVHTRKINSNFKEDYNLEKFAELTNNFTGAEIESVITNAKSKAISRVLSIENLADINVNEIVITSEDIIEAIKETKTSHGDTNKIFNIVDESKFEESLSLLNGVKQFYITGQINTNILVGNLTKTLYSACYISKNLNVSCIKHISSEMLLTHDLHEILTQVYRSKTSVVILETIENIIGFNPLINNCNNNILQIIYTLINKVVSDDVIIHVIITTNNKNLCERIFHGSNCNYIYID